MYTPLYETSQHTLSYEVATRLANDFSRGVCVMLDGKEIDLYSKTYHTALRDDTVASEYCWYITNKFDPRVFACSQ